MASIIKFNRRRPVIHHQRAKVLVERESREARRSLFILIGSFFVTATVMCAAVVVMVSSTWTDMVLMSAFVLVFALLKIVLADALIYTMLRYDEASTNVPGQAGAIRSYPPRAPIRQPPVKGGRRVSRKTTRLPVATGKAQTTTT
jgi:hypothetical protein